MASRRAWFTRDLMEFFADAAQLHGFVLDEVTDFRAELHFDSTSVSLYYEPRSRGIDVIIECPRDTPNTNRLSLHDLLRSLGVLERDHTLQVSAANQMELRAALEHTAKQLRTPSVASAIRSPLEIRKAHQWVVDDSSSRMKQYELQKIMNVARDAFSRREFAEVVRLYLGLESSLPPIEIKRLGIAKRRTRR